MDMKRREVELDIAVNAGALVAEGYIMIEDSRDFINRVIPEMAELYLDIYSPNIGDDYLDSVDNFSHIQLRARYGIREDDLHGKE